MNSLSFILIPKRMSFSTWHTELPPLISFRIFLRQNFSSYFILLRRPQANKCYRATSDPPRSCIMHFSACASQCLFEGVFVLMSTFCHQKRGELQLTISTDGTWLFNRKIAAWFRTRDEHYYASPTACSEPQGWYVQASNPHLFFCSQQTSKASYIN